jgi:hypothetical protein
MRLIDADSLLEALDKMGRNYQTQGKILAQMYYVDDVTKLVTNAPTVQREGWVSVKDISPERIEGMKILCFGNGYIFEAEYEDGYWVNLGGDVFTHWQPLPAAPTDTE